MYYSMLMISLLPRRLNWLFNINKRLGQRRNLSQFRPSVRRRCTKARYQ